MKATKLFLPWIVLLFFEMNYGQAAAPAAVDNKPVTTEVKSTEKTTATGMPETTVVKETTTTTKQSQESKENTTVEKALTPPQKFLVLLPVLLFFLCLFITFLFAKKSKVDFRKAFYCEEPEEITKLSGSQTNPAETVKVTLLDDKGMSVYMPSVSRIIVFLSGLTTLAVVVCFVSYNAYCMIKGQPLPDFKNLFEIITGLGLGVVPYGFNKLTSTTKP